VLVWKIDRYGRSLKHLVNALADLSAYGVAFVSFRYNLDLSTPSGRLMFQIIGAMAEFERSLIQERVRAGLRNPRAKGRRLGRPAISLDVSEVLRLRSQGLPWRAVAARLPFPRAAEIWLDSRKNINDGAHSAKYMYACYIRALMKFFGERLRRSIRRRDRDRWRIRREHTGRAHA
jgi:DNA invertase Pin-like site-specific DNA recombinase